MTAAHNFTGRHAISGRPLSSKCAIPDRVSAWFHHQDVDREAWTEIELALLDPDGQPLWLVHANPAIDLAVLPFAPRSALVPTLGLDAYAGLPTVSP